MLEDKWLRRLASMDILKASAMKVLVPCQFVARAWLFGTMHGLKELK